MVPAAANHRHWPGLLLALALAGTAGCAGSSKAISDLPTSSPSPIPTETVTPVWFPPTPTATSVFIAAIPSATPDSSLASGPVLLQDDFNDSLLWQTSQSEGGNITFGTDELTLAIAQSKFSLTSLRKQKGVENQAVLDNFYLEITVSPSLCQGDDLYGILFREATPGDAYRFLISCRGKLRLERIQKNLASVVQDWVLSPQIIPEIPASYQVGILAAGSDLRFYINDSFQFGVRDATLASGGLGVYARSVGTTPLTVSFSSLVVHQAPAVIIPLPTATATVSKKK
jgi:hypothetical protein